MRAHVFISHPIQHFVPWLRQLSEVLDGGLMVHYGSRQGLEPRRDAEFGESFAWDMDLVGGYQHRFWEPQGTQRGPGDGFFGIRYPGVGPYLAQQRPDAVLICGWLFAGYWQVAIAARRLRIPYFVRGESNLLAKGGPAKWWLKQQSIGRLCRRAAGCVAIGSRNADLYRAYGVADDRIWMAPYFIDTAWIETETARLRLARASLREKFGLPPDAVVFLFMGKLIPKKHPEHLIEAWRRLPAAARQRSALLIAGSGAMLSALKGGAGNDPRIVFAGFLNRRALPEAYAVSDALVLPSDAGETWGLVVNEAMASGLPVIVSDQVGCAPDLVADGRTGYVVPFGSVDALSQRLCRSIESPEQLTRMGAAARTQVDAASVERAVAATADALRGDR